MIRLLSCGYNFIHREGIRIERPTGAGNYAFVFFRSHSQVVLNGKSLIADKHTYIVFQPQTPHLYRELAKPFINDWFHCEGEGVADFLTRIQFPVDTVVKATDPMLIARSIMELHSYQRLGGPLRDAIIDTELKSLFMKLSNLQRRVPGDGHLDHYFRQFSDLRGRLYNSPQTHVSVSELAASVNLSKPYFQHLYKELFGCSATSDMINGRLEYAKYLLDNSSLSVTAISSMCGYENDTHFMRQFKKYIGLTPSAYRARR